MFYEITNRRVGGLSCALSDIVAYGVNGVCTVTEITTKRIDKVNVEYYVLSPNATKTAKVFVPVQNEKLVGNRAVLTKDFLLCRKKKSGFPIRI